MQASVHEAPRGFDVVDELANTHMMHLRAKGRQRRVARRRLCTRLREAEAHLLSCRPLRCTPARWASEKAMRIRLRRQRASKHASGDRSMHWGDTHASKSPSIFPLRRRPALERLACAQSFHGPWAAGFSASDKRSLCRPSFRSRTTANLSEWSSRLLSLPYA